MQWYENQPKLCSILPDMLDDRYDQLAEIANELRNELAREKQTIEPSADLLNAIRLVEQISPTNTNASQKT